MEIVAAAVVLMTASSAGPGTLPVLQFAAASQLPAAGIDPIYGGQQRAFFERLEIQAKVPGPKFSIGARTAREFPVEELFHQRAMEPSTLAIICRHQRTPERIRELSVYRGDTNFGAHHERAASQKAALCVG
jgi:hypothetical protein